MSVIVGNYVIDRELGRGGMGVVYAATHRVLGRPAAIKLLMADTLHHRDQVERFFNEARAAMAIDHPGIVEVFDVGIGADNRAYIAMELLDGESLHHRLQRGALPVRVAIDYARQIADALAAAHDAGIVHRDLKPANVIVCRDGRVKIVDFGIAKLANTVAVRTMTGAVLGTPSYMSPEQCAGGRELDARSDLYALGCVVFAMVTGAPPFHGETGAVIGMHQFVAPPRLRDRFPAASPALDAAVDCLLSKSPGDRFQTARAAATALAARDVSVLGRSAVEPTADAPAASLGTGSTRSIAFAGPIYEPPPPQQPANDPAPVPVPAPDTRQPGGGRRRAMIALVVAFAIAVPLVALLVAQCGARDDAPVIVAAIDAATPPPMAIDAAIVVVAPADAAPAPDATRIARAGRDARGREPPPETFVSPPDATVRSLPDDGSGDIAFRTFEAGDTRIVFTTTDRVKKTWRNMAGGAVIGTYRKRRREFQIDWDPDAAHHGSLRERFRRIGQCSLAMYYRVDKNGAVHDESLVFEQTVPACP